MRLIVNVKFAEKLKENKMLTQEIVIFWSVLSNLFALAVVLAKAVDNRPSDHF